MGIQQCNGALAHRSALRVSQGPSEDESLGKSGPVKELAFVSHRC